MVLFENGIEIEEYFRYHPISSEARRAKHEQVNTATLKAATALVGDCTLPQISEQIAELRWLVTDSCKDLVCQKWAFNSISCLYNAALSGDREAVVMTIQQVRMFLNQGIVVDELVAEREHAKPATE